MRSRTQSEECGTKDAIGKYESAENVVAIIQCRSLVEEKIQIRIESIVVDNVGGVVVSYYALSTSARNRKLVGHVFENCRGIEREGRLCGAFLKRIESGRLSGPSGK